MNVYTERVDGYQIRDIAYLGKPPFDDPVRFDVVKWFTEEKPYMGTVLHETPIGWMTKEELITEHCYSVGVLEWNEHELDFDFHSVGLRWLEEKPSEAVVDMILKFCEEKKKEIYENSDKFGLE